jgi:hypothetical protein
MRHTDKVKADLGGSPSPPTSAARSQEPKLRHQTQEPRARSLLGVLYFCGER